MMGLSLAHVVRYYPESNTADIVRVEDGWRAARVPVIAGQASTSSGLHQVVDPESISPEGAPTAPDARVVIAVVAYHDRGAPIILGFLPPAVRETLFADGRYVNRLASDVYVTVDKDGNTEWFHPSGTYVRIAETPDHEDLTKRDFNSRWNIHRNTGRRPHLKVSIGGGGIEQANLWVDPGGNVRLLARGAVVIDSPSVTIAGDLLVGGRIFAGAGISTTGNVSDVAGTLAQVRLAHLTHGHGTPLGNTTPPTIGSPPFLPPPTAEEVELEQQGEDVFVPAMERRDAVVPPITLPQYLRGLDAMYPDDFTAEIVESANTLLAKVNALLQEAGIVRSVTSGWRPLAYNIRVPGASRTSHHITARAIDLGDKDRRLTFWLSRNPRALEVHGLYLELPAATPTWVHLQDVAPDSGARIFPPS